MTYSLQMQFVTIFTLICHHVIMNFQTSFLVFVTQIVLMLQSVEIEVSVAGFSWLCFSMSCCYAIIHIYVGVYLYISLLSLYIVRWAKNRNYIALNGILKIIYLFLNCTVTLHSFQGKQLSASFDIDPIMLLSSSSPNWSLNKEDFA